MQSSHPDFSPEFGANAAYVDDLFARWSDEPTNVAEDWRTYFERIAPERARDHAARPAAVASIAAPATADGAEPGARPADHEPLRGVAAKIVRNMEDSLGIPTATSVRSLSVRLLDENRNILNRHLNVAGRPKASFTHFIAFAIVRAVREMPQLNAAFTQDGDQPIRIRREAINLGLAIDLEGKNGTRTLVVPNLKNAGAMGFDQFLAAYGDAVDRARLGKLTPDDFQGTTITLTNPGTIGTVASVPRLMPGQGLIVATGAIAYPAEYQSASSEMLTQLGISKVMTMTSTYDHRIIQGAESGLLLHRIDELLQGKDAFYEEIFESLDCPHTPWKRAQDRNAMLAGGGAPSLEVIEKQARVLQLINAYRVRGCRIADLDPLEFKPEFHPELDLATYGLTVFDLDRVFMTGGLGGKPMATLREILEILLDTYSRRIGVEYMHISDPKKKAWLQQRMEPTRNLEPFAPKEQRRILEKLNAAEAFEKFLHTRYLGHKRFSLEGAETLIPMLDELLNRATTREAKHAVIGMAHRGRLNVLVNTFNKSYGKVFSEFEGLVDPSTVQGSGDVKYHLGADGEHITPEGRRLPITLASNPSHLEAVNPVVEGLARAKQEDGPADDRRAVLPILIHGDAAFAGQGVVAETLNMSQLAGYRTGGTVHIVINNQIGYTAGPKSTRSTYYCTDMAKSIGAPILHVNGDYPESCLRAIRVAFDYREQFAGDVVVDMVCYRRHGHNETDEPAYTQPLMYQKIARQISVRDRYGRLLVQRKQMTEAERQASVDAYAEQLRLALEQFRALPAAPEPEALAIRPPAEDPRDFQDEPSQETGVARETLERILTVATQPPEGHHVHPNLARQLKRRVDMLHGELPIDWGCGEALAFGSLLAEGTPIRLAGQDSGRGTFSQRHSVVRDQADEKDWIPLNHVSEGQARFEVVDSLLSEEAGLGFEFGFALARPQSLVLWEAQFGDFCNGAQIQIDQFLAASEAKWNQTSGVVMLLPHGYDGQGPEHSSGRVERFLQLCATGNMTVANCTTAAQYFHLLRRQAKLATKRPLIVMTPKSLLKKKEAGSTSAEFTTGAFRPVIDDGADPALVTRVLICSGKVYFDLDEWRVQNAIKDTAIIRLEQLYPLPRRALQDAVARYLKGFKNLAWVQEEPKNMGAWSFMLPQFQDLGMKARYVGRAASSSPATGSLRMHQAEQADLVRRAFG